MNIRSSLALAVFLIFAGASVQDGLRAALRPPSVPLVAHDPYFSIWSPADQLAGAETTHWTGKPQRLRSLVRIDGVPFRLMGTEPQDVPALPQAGLRVLPTRTIYTFASDKVRLNLTFLTPALPGRLDVLARPVTYIVWRAEAADNQLHAVEVYFDAAAELAVNTPEQAVCWGRVASPSLQGVRIGSEAQPILEKQGDDLRIDWGYAYLAAGRSAAVRVAVADGARAVEEFRKDGSFPPRDVPPEDGTAASRAPKLAARLDLGKVGAASAAQHLLLAYDDEFSLRYFDDRLRPYWRRNGTDAASLLAAAARDYAALEGSCAKFDTELMADLARVGGEGYAELAALAYRQTLAGSKLVADGRGQPLFFPKENHSNGCIGTVDVIYPMSPFCLLFSPALAKGVLVPLLDYASSPRWKFPFAPHDLGRYPFATGQVYGGGERTEDRQMMVEESANMLLMVAALAQVEGDTALAAKYWPVLSKWAEYLQAKGFDPENQLCTDDFAGHLAHNVNLSAKAIVALGAFARLAERRGDAATAQSVTELARGFARRWLEMADNGDHFRLAFDKPGTWSQKYNLVWDRLLDLALFPAGILRKEMDYYLRVQQRYGLPLDNRQTYTKLDWTVWTATLTGRRQDFDAILAPVLAWVNATPDRSPLTDWYFTDTARKRGFTGRPVVGGLFLPVLGDRELWQKWARAGANTAGPWAPIPIHDYAAVVTTGEEEPGLWRVTWEMPLETESWMKLRFQLASSWQEKAAPFGMEGEAGIPIRTEWALPEIWMRREFKLEAVDPRSLRLRLTHTGDCEVYLNGLLACRREGGLRGYENFEINPAALSALRKGTNVIAVHARSGVSGAAPSRRVHLDVGIIALKAVRQPG